MEDREIDLVDVIKKLWQGRRIIMWSLICSAIIGVAIAFILPSRYVVECVLGLEIEDNTMRISVDGISPLQGMNMGNTRSSRVVNPSMYPNIFFSIPFQKELMYAKLPSFGRKDSVSFYEYFLDKKLEKEIVDSLLNSDRLTKDEIVCLDYLKKNINIKINNKNDNLSISVKMPDAYMAAGIAQQAEYMLQLYITNYKIAKAQTALNFIEERYRELRQELELKQRMLIDFREKNKGISSVQTETQGKILENDYKLFFELYSDIVKQREKARIQVKEDMPILTMIEPVILPFSPSKPNRLLIVLGVILLGGVIGCGSILFSNMLKSRE